MKAVVAGLAVVLLAGVWAPPLVAADSATEQRLQRIERRVARVSELTLQVDALQRENRQLRGEIESLQYMIKQLERKQRDIYLDIDQRLSSMSQAAPAPAPAPVAPAASAPAAADAPKPAQAEADAPVDTPNAPPADAATAVDPQQIQREYKAAYALLSPAQKRYDDAAKAFTVFLENYPDSPLAANAQYWLAEAYYVSQNNDKALAAFRVVVDKYPSSPKVPGALYKTGRLLNVQGKTAEAREVLNRVVKDHASSPAAGLARELLGKIGQ